MTSTMNLLNVFPFFWPDRRKVDILDRETILKNSAVDISEYMLGTWEIGELQDNTLKFAFNPDSNDLLFTDRWQDISDYRDKEKEAVDTIADLKAIHKPDTDEIRFVREANGYFQYKLWVLEWTDEAGEPHQDKYLGWHLLTIGFQNAFYNYGKENEVEVKTEFSTLDAITSSDDSVNAATRQKGSLRSELYSYETFSPRLIFYNGNNTGAYLTDTLSLDWEDENIGLLQKRWINWARFWATKQEVSTEAYFDLSALDYMIRNIYKKFRSEEGDFIIEEMECEFGISQIGNTKIKGYKVNYSPGHILLTDSYYLNDIVWIDQVINVDNIGQFRI